MKRIILGLAVCILTLGIAGVASAHPRYARVISRPLITPAPVVVAPVAPVVVAPAVEVVRPVYRPIHWHRR